METFTRSTRTFTLIVFLMVAPLTAHAQGTMTGVVRDASGLVLPGVAVEVTSGALQRKLATVTDSKGEFKITSLPPGKYTSLLRFRVLILPSLTALK